MNYVTRNNYKPGKGKQFNKQSMTIPDQTLSLKEMLKRFVVNGNIETFQGEYDENSDLPLGIEKLDKIEKIDLARKIQTGIKAAQQGLEQGLELEREKQTAKKAEVIDVINDKADLNSSAGYAKSDG